MYIISLGRRFSGARSVATTRDHVPSKLLLERPYPQNLSTVPSCDKCNQGWSLDEEYFGIVIAHISDQPHMAVKIDEGGLVDRALISSPRLDDRLINELGVAQDGRVYLQPDNKRLENVAAKIAFGLFCLCYCSSQSMNQFECCWLGQVSMVQRDIIASMRIQSEKLRRANATIQDNVFNFAFRETSMANPSPLICLIEFHQILFAIVNCPAPPTELI